jgi:DNA modification methylase
MAKKGKKAPIRPGSTNWSKRIVERDDAVDPEQLLANPFNFRIHPAIQEDALEGALDDLGWLRTVLVNKRSGHVIDGHLRVLLAMKRGETVPVDYVDLSDAEEKKALATLDPLGAMAGLDKDKHADLLKGLTTKNDGLAKLLADLKKKAGLATADTSTADASQPEPKKTKIKLGDLFQCGRHRVLCGDATKLEHAQRALGGRKANMVFTDPPYGVNVTSKGGDAIEGDISFTAIPLMFDVLDKILAAGAWVYVCGGQSNMPLYGAMFERYFKQLPMVIIWDKGKTSVMRRNGYHSCFEFIYYAYKEGGGATWFGGRDSDSADDVIHVPSVSNTSRIHPTEKPVALPARTIRNSCALDGLVFDPFGGSGSTLMAAEAEGRDSVTIELTPIRVQAILDRFEAVTGVKPTAIKK